MRVRAGAEGKLAFETKSPADATFLCRAIEFLVATALQLLDGKEVGRCSIREAPARAGMNAIGSRRSPQGGGRKLELWGLKSALASSMKV